MSSMRLAVNARAWKPSVQELITCLKCIQPQEQERICRFKFTLDAKLSLLGRLLLRKVIAAHTSLSWSDIVLGRTEKGKPLLLSDDNTHNLAFNVSHSGDYTVMVAGHTEALGVDVADVRDPLSSSVERFFELMADVFSDAEWQHINTSPVPLREFYVHWALKESYVKAAGTGIGFGLQRISFTSSPHLERDSGTVVGDATALLDGQPVDNWCFEQLWLDAKHVVAIASHPPLDPADRLQPFEVLAMEDWLAELQDCETFPLYEEENRVTHILQAMKDKKARC
eukprot:m.155559 g.155559  ORF g.155559 m.155559 type:complete len:283 (-) comp16421_c0_seq5:3394-4242(-)